MNQYRDSLNACVRAIANALDARRKSGIVKPLFYATFARKRPETYMAGSITTSSYTRKRTVDSLETVYDIIGRKVFRTLTPSSLTAYAQVVENQGLTSIQLNIVLSTYSNRTHVPDVADITDTRNPSNPHRPHGTQDAEVHNFRYRRPPQRTLD